MKLRSSRLCSMSLLFIALCANSLNGQEVNLITNGDFEVPLEKNRFWKLNKGAVLQKGDVYKGENAIKITRTTPEGNIRYSLESNFIPYTNGPLKVSAWWKGKNITQGEESWHKALFHIYFFDKLKNRISRHSSIGSMSGDSNWKECKRTYYPTSNKKSKWHKIPDGTKYVKIEFLLLDCTGVLCIDDVKIISEASPVKTTPKANQKNI